MGYSLQDFCRDTTAILKTGSSRQHVDKVKAHMERERPGVYFGRQLHSTQTPVGTCYLRVTGTDLENIERLRIDAATGKIQRIFGRQTGAPAAVS